MGGRGRGERVGEGLGEGENRGRRMLESLLVGSEASKEGKK
jgi:hypothetical protein